MHSLLVVVDYQVDFVSGALGFDGAAQLEQTICQAIRRQRAAGGDVCFTMDTHDPSYLTTQEGRNLPVLHCVRHTPGWALFGSVAALRQETDPVFEKQTFGSLSLAQYVQQKGYEAVTLVGLVSNICVLSNAVLIKAALPEAQVCVDCACTASFDTDLHEKALDVLAGLQVQLLGRTL